MNIHSDQNIPQIKEAFNSLKSKDFSANVSFFQGRELKNNDLKDKDILLVRSVTKVNKDLIQNSHLKWIASATAGINHVDLGYLQKNKILFFYAAGSNALSVVEYVLFGIFNYCVKYQQDLTKLHIGIVGCGNVGGRLAKILKRSNLHVTMVDPPLAELLPEGKYHKKMTALRNCDIITAHTPLIKTGKYSTYHLFSENFFSQLNKKILFINTSRGEVVNEKALLKNKQNGKVKEIILDVWENEPTINPEAFSHCLLGSPHIAGYSQDGKLKGSQMIYEQFCLDHQFSSKWNYRDSLLVPNEKIIYSFATNKYDKVAENPQTTTESTFLDILTKIYDFKKDHQRLIDIMHYPQKIISKKFDQLRKNYPKRYEWCNYTIVFKNAKIYQKFTSLKGITSLFKEVRLEK